MTPSLAGRIQTRVFLLVVVGGLWTLLVTPILGTPAGVTLADRYEQTYLGLLLVLLFGLVWELVYHGLQQFRWEKDWPTSFGLVTGINESVLVWFVLRSTSVGDPAAALSVGAFTVYFWSTWLVVWAAANGPLQVLFVRWRFRGGRML